MKLRHRGFDEKALTVVPRGGAPGATSPKEQGLSGCQAAGMHMEEERTGSEKAPTP